MTYVSICQQKQKAVKKGFTLSSQPFALAAGNDDRRCFIAFYRIHIIDVIRC